MEMDFLLHRHVQKVHSIQLSLFLKNFWDLTEIFLENLGETGTKCKKHLKPCFMWEEDLKKTNLNQFQIPRHY